MRGKKNIYGIKSFGLKVEDLDEGSRKVVGYLSAFGVKDSDMDVIRPGSFVKSISERGPKSSSNRKIAFLRMHEWSNQIGKFLELSEDEKGLRFVGQLGTSTKGEDALRDYQEGIIREHSIGFRYVDGKIEYNEEEEYYDITEINLFEGSAVTFGANEFTPVIDVAKGLTQDTIFENLQKEFTAITKALKNGKGTDDRLYKLEMRLTALQQKYATLFSTLEPLSDSTPTQKKEGKDKKPETDQAKEFYIKMLSQ